jgi:hypothetical protein
MRFSKWMAQLRDTMAEDTTKGTHGLLATEKRFNQDKEIPRTVLIGFTHEVLCGGLKDCNGLTVSEVY